MPRQVADRAFSRNAASSPSCVAEAIPPLRTGKRPLRHRNARAAKAGAIAKRIDAGKVGQAIVIAARHQAGGASASKSWLQPSMPQQFVGGLEAIAEANDIDVEMPHLSDRRAQSRRLSFDRGDDGAMDHPRSAGTARA